MARPDWRRSRFDAPDDEPLGGLANLVDIMLVFACGLMAAIAAQQADPRGAIRDVEAGRELPEVPSNAGEAGAGYEAVGRVYREPETGRLLMIDEGEE